MNDTIDLDKYTSNFYNLLKNHFITIFENFIREIDISFEYINKNIINNLNEKIIKKMQNNDIYFKEMIEKNNLNTFKDFLHPLVKPRTKDFDFFENVSYFGIEFKLFKNENKNTKKTLVNYLYQFYTVSNFIINLNNTKDPESLQTFIQTIIPLKKTNDISKTPDMFNIFNKLSNVSSKDKIFEPFKNLMQNKEIMNIANEITSDISSMNIDPMSLMSSLLTGNLNGQTGEFINKITNKISSKINNGDIDKTLLEEQAQNFLNSMN